MQIIGRDSEEILVEYDQIRSPSGLDPAPRSSPPRDPIRLLEVRPEGAGEPDPLLGMKRLAVGLVPAPAQERRLDREERPGAVKRSVRSKEKPGARPGERSPGVGARS